MRSDIEEIVFHYYPTRALQSPLGNSAITWTHDVEHKLSHALIADLKARGFAVAAGTRANYAVAEEIVVDGRLRIHLSFLGAFAAINRGMSEALGERDHDRLLDVSEILAKHGITVLDDEALNEPVSWFNASVTVWHCLFEGSL